MHIQIFILEKIMHTFFKILCIQIFVLKKIYINAMHFKELNIHTVMHFKEFI